MGSVQDLNVVRAKGAGIFRDACAFSTDSAFQSDCWTGAVFLEWGGWFCALDRCRVSVFELVVTHFLDHLSLFSYF